MYKRNHQLYIIPHCYYYKWKVMVKTNKKHTTYTAFIQNKNLVYLIFYTTASKTVQFYLFFLRN